MARWVRWLKRARECTRGMLMLGLTLRWLLPTNVNLQRPVLALALRDKEVHRRVRAVCAGRRGALRVRAEANHDGADPDERARAQVCAREQQEERAIRGARDV